MNEHPSKKRQHVIGQPLQDPVLVSAVVDVKRVLDPVDSSAFFSSGEV